MGDKALSDKRRLRRLSPTMSGLDARKDLRAENKGVRTKIHQGVEAGVRTGKTQKGRDAKEAAAKQQQKEDLRLVEATDDASRGVATTTAKRSGRRSLVKSSPSGKASNLGGT